MSGAGSDGTVPLRPRPTPVADLFEAAFGLYRRHFPLIVGIVAVFLVPIAFATVPLAAWNADMARAQWTGVPPRLPTIEEVVSTAVVLAAIALLAFVLGTFAAASVAYLAGRSGGPAPRLGDVLGALRDATPRLFVYVLVLAFAWLMVVVVAVAVPLITLVMSESAGLTIGVTIVTALAALGLLIGTAARWSVAIPVLMLEGLGPLDALRRSWRLVAGRTWRTLGIMFVAGLVVGVVGGFISPIYIPGVAEGILSGSLSSYLLVAIVSGVVQVFVGPIFPLLLTVLYLDYAGARPAA